MITKVSSGQDIFDVCLKNYGNLDNILTMLDDNNLTANSYLYSSQEIMINSELANEIKVVNEFKRNSYIPVNTSEDDLTTVIGDFNSDFNNDFNINI